MHEDKNASFSPAMPHHEAAVDDALGANPSAPSAALTTPPLARQPGTAGAGDALRGETWWRRAYGLWAWLFFIPCLAVATLVFSGLAIGLATFSPRLAFHTGRVWGYLMCRVNFTPVVVHGRHHLDRRRSYVIMANHLSLFDTLAFYGHWGEQFRWVMKQELRRVPGLGWACARIGHIFVDRTNHRSALVTLNRGAKQLQQGVSVVFFPEGTRSPDGHMQGFKKGGFVLAQQLGLPILPVSISGSADVLPNRSFKLRPGRVIMTIHPPIEVTQYDKTEREALMRDVAQVIASGLAPHEQPLPTPSDTAAVA